jgi:hypothetical protein
MAAQWNRKAAAEILKSPEVLRDVRGRAERVAAAAGPGFEASSMIGRNRARASVRAISFSARVRNSRDNILLRALEAGRGG